MEYVNADSNTICKKTINFFNDSTQIIQIYKIAEGGVEVALTTCSEGGGDAGAVKVQILIHQ